MSVTWYTQLPTAALCSPNKSWVRWSHSASETDRWMETIGRLASLAYLVSSEPMREPVFLAHRLRSQQCELEAARHFASTVKKGIEECWLLRPLSPLDTVHIPAWGMISCRPQWHSGQSHRKLIKIVSLTVMPRGWSPGQV